MADVVPLDAAKPSHDAPDLEKRSSQDLVEKEKIKAGESQQAPNNHKEMAVDEKPTSSATGAGCTIPSESAATNNATEKQPQVGPQFPELTSDHPLSKLLQRLPSILESARYAEVYGVDISNPNSGHTKNILQKFLRANSNDVAKAEEQLLGTLKWRREFNPLAALEEVHSRNKFYGLGYVTTLKSDGDLATQRDIVVSWNIYGAVESNEVTFGDVDSFVRWRVALMELSLQKLSLASGTLAIPDWAATPTDASRDPYQCIQVHDYLNVSFLRQDPLVKAASKKTIDTFSRYYPETLSRKFFVNVPVLMGWVFSAFKLVLPKATVRKFTVLSYGTDVAGELLRSVPKSYGGDGAELGEIGEQTKLD